MNLESLKAFLRKPATILVASVVVLGLLSWFVVAQVQRSVKNDGVQQQEDIIALQREVGLNISKCLDQTNIAKQVAQQQYASLKDTLTSILQARYVDANGNATRADGVLGGGAFISALHEAYPQYDTTTWQKFMAVAVHCRDDVYDAQDHLQVFAANFRAWAQQGNVFTHPIRAEFPTNALNTYDAKQRKQVYGMEALNYLTRTILTSDAQNAMDSGIMPDQNLGSPVPSPSAR